MNVKRLLIVLVAIGASTCSLIVEKSAVQCSTDADCVKFAPHPFCVEGVCVESGLGPAGCFYGQAATDADYLNACTSASCIPFDNCARLGLCDAAAPLPALIAHP